MAAATKKKTSQKAARKAPAKKAHASRSGVIQMTLQKSKKPMTTRELCKVLGFDPKAEAKFVSSIMIALGAQKKVTKKKKACSVTGRTVNAFAMRKGA